jgi:hypothetical protein
MPDTQRKSLRAQPQREMRHIVSTARKPISPEALFDQCGRNANDIEDIELFFRELRGLVEEGFAEETRSHSNVTIRRRR